MLKRKPIAQQIVLPCAAGVLLMVAILVLALSVIAQRNALTQTEEALALQADMTIGMLEYAQDALKQRAVEALAQFERSLGTEARLTGREVAAGSEALPEIAVGGVVMNGNAALLGQYAKIYGDREPAILVRKGERLYRGVTLLKDQAGNYRVGELIADNGAYPSILLTGKPFLGSLERNGKLYILAANPLKDAAGKVIGAVTMRLDAEADIKLIREKLAKIRIGQTGFPYILSVPSGDAKDIRFIHHPAFGGKALSEVEPQVRDIVQRVIAAKGGTLTYEWQKDGQGADKMVVVRELPDLHWIVASGSWVSEFTAQAESLRRQITFLAIACGILLLLALAVFVRQRLKPLAHLAALVARFGTGDLTVRTPAAPGSACEIDVIGHSINTAAEAMGSLAGSIRATSGHLQQTAQAMSAVSGHLSAATGQQSEAAAAMAGNTEELSVSVDQVAENASQALGLTRETVTSVDHGVATVHATIAQLQDTAGTVQEAAVHIEELGRQSAEIHQVLNAIRDISEQTNLLALNAAIEAARAGEAGRGFAVVAGEVRKLAEQSGKSAALIDSILASIQTGVTRVADSARQAVAQVDSNVEASRQVEEALRAIEARAAQTTSAMEDIAHATREQSTASQSIARQVEAVAQTVGDTSRSAEENRRHADELLAVARELEEEVARLKVA